MKAKLSLIISAAAVVAMCAFVFYMSALPADDSTVLSTGVIWHIVGFVVPGYDQLSAAEQLQWQEALQNPVRKTAHFLEYAVLGALMLNLVRQIEKARKSGPASGGTRNRTAAFAWLLTVAYAATDELHQLFVPGRAGRLSDVGVDAAGALLGIALLLLALHLAHARRTTR